MSTPSDERITLDRVNLGRLADAMEEATPAGESPPDRPVQDCTVHVRADPVAEARRVARLRRLAGDVEAAEVIEGLLAALDASRSAPPERGAEDPSALDPPETPASPLGASGSQHGASTIESWGTHSGAQACRGGKNGSGVMRDKGAGGGCEAHSATGGRIVVDPGILLSAFRYALGRATYIVGDTARELIAHRDALPAHWRAQIVRDIDQAIGTDRAGMDCDARQWARVADAMREATP